MAYRIVKGTASVNGKSPDGDTVSFTISQHSDWIWPKTQNGRFPQFNASYQAAIRLEAVDALELHYTIPFAYPEVKLGQPLDLAKAARDRLLALLGFDLSKFTESAGHVISDSANQRVPITLAYNAIDRYGRIVGFVFVEDMGFEVSDNVPEILLTPAQIEKSVNAQLLREGLVYPTFYGALYPELRNVFASLAVTARSDKLGIWPRHQDSFVFERKPDARELETLVMMPKLFRRLAEHLCRNGAISGFKDFVREGNEMTVDTRDVRLTNFSSFFRVDALDAQRTKYELRLTHRPEELIFANT